LWERSQKCFDRFGGKVRGVNSGSKKPVPARIAIGVPHPDVLNGTFQQSEFAADLTAVWTGKATPEYWDAKAFYERTYITEGMGRLLTQVSKRLNGKGGEPVIQLQTAFGGGKTHTGESASGR
jgi:hypothetical protein